MNLIQQHLTALSDSQLLATCAAVQDMSHSDDSPIVQVCKKAWPNQPFNVQMLIGLVPHLLQEMVRRQAGEIVEAVEPHHDELVAAANVISSQVMEDVDLEVSIADHQTMVDNLLEMHDQGMITINPPD